MCVLVSHLSKTLQTDLFEKCKNESEEHPGPQGSTSEWRAG